MMHLLSELYVLMKKNLSHATCQCEKKAEGFQISLFYWLFSKDVMAVKGLNTMSKS